MDKLANATINNFCQVFIIYDQVIQCYDVRVYQCTPKPSLVQLKKVSLFCWLMASCNHKYPQATINMTPCYQQEGQKM